MIGFVWQLGSDDVFIKNKITVLVRTGLAAKVTETGLEPVHFLHISTGASSGDFSDKIQTCLSVCPLTVRFEILELIF